MDWEKKTGSRKLWARITAMIILMAAFTSATPRTAKKVMTPIGVIGDLSIYILSGRLADSKPIDIKVSTKKIMEKEEM